MNKGRATAALNSICVKTQDIITNLKTFRAKIYFLYFYGNFIISHET
jgi:hypothetical protein